MTNDELMTNARMTNAIPCEFVIGTLSFIVFRSAKFSRKSDAILSLPAIVLALQISTSGTARAAMRRKCFALTRFLLARANAL